MEYTVEYLSNNHNIQELRFMLIELGGRPKTKNKQEIIDEIIKIQKGELIPTVTTKRGRPSNKLKYMQSDFDGSGLIRVCDHKTAFKYGDQIQGIFNVNEDGYGVVHVANYCFSPNDAYVSKKVVKKFELKKGDFIQGRIKANTEGEFSELIDVLAINSIPVQDFKRNDFEDFVANYPDKQIQLSDGGDLTLRLIDLFAPIGRGQRGLIYGPKKSGKMTLLKKIAFEITKLYPETHVIVLLIGERPEEINDFKKGLDAEVVFSTFEQPAHRQVGISEVCLARAQRIAETGKDVVLLVDSITKLVKLYNSKITGKVDGTGWIDNSAIDFAKKFMSSAICSKIASLSIIATAIDEQNPVDNAIIDEISDICNMEICLKERKKFQNEAIDILRSFTVKDDYLLSPKQIAVSYKIRNMIEEKKFTEKQLFELLEKTTTNEEFVARFK